MDAGGHLQLDGQLGAETGPEDHEGTQGGDPDSPASPRREHTASTIIAEAWAWKWTPPPLPSPPEHKPAESSTGRISGND